MQPVYIHKRFFGSDGGKKQLILHPVTSNSTLVLHWTKDWFWASVSWGEALVTVAMVIAHHCLLTVFSIKVLKITILRNVVYWLALTSSPFLCWLTYQAHLNYPEILQFFFLYTKTFLDQHNVWHKAAGGLEQYSNVISMSLHYSGPLSTTFSTTAFSSEYFCSNLRMDGFSSVNRKPSRKIRKLGESSSNKDLWMSEESKVTNSWTCSQASRNSQSISNYT